MWQQMRRMHRIMYLLLLYAVGASATWRLDGPPWRCDGNCRKSWSKPKLQTSSEGCLTRADVGDYPFEVLGVDGSAGCTKFLHPHLSFCVRRINGTFLIANCNVNITDYRIPCRNTNDPMSWYRGVQSVTTSGKQCLRWDSVSTVISESQFDEADGPSVTYDSWASLSRGLHSHENYCRNPDEWNKGPWCFVKGPNGDEIREACFKDCWRYAEREMCLAKMFFPYSVRSTSNIPDVPSVMGSPGDFLDLSDMLDVPRIAHFHRQNRAMFQPTLYLDHIRHYPGDISTRLRCYQTGIQHHIAGPWTYSSASRHPYSKYAVWLEEALKANTAETLERERATRGDTGPYYSLWRPCFLACEDTNIQCWPASQNAYDRARFPYYGPKNYDKDGNQCISPNYAYQVLVMLDRRFHLNEKSATLLKVLRDEIISANGTEKRLKNNFVIYQGNRMVSRRCFTLGDFLVGIEKGARRELAEWNEELERIMSIGAGCFVEINSRETIEYRACFDSCDCNDTVFEPEVLTHNACEDGKVCNLTSSLGENDDESNPWLQPLDIPRLFADINASSTFSLQPILLLLISALCIICVGFTVLLTLHSNPLVALKGIAIGALRFLRLLPQTKPSDSAAEPRSGSGSKKEKKDGEPVSTASKVPDAGDRPESVTPEEISASKVGEAKEEKEDSDGEGDESTPKVEPGPTKIPGARVGGKANQRPRTLEMTEPDEPTRTIGVTADNEPEPAAEPEAGAAAPTRIVQITTTQPGGSTKPKSGSSKSPQPSGSAKPKSGSSKSDQAGGSEKPGPGSSKSPQPGGSARIIRGQLMTDQPGLPAKPKPALPTQPEPGILAKPTMVQPVTPQHGIPAKPTMVQPVIPRPGIPAQPRPGQLMTPQPGITSKPQPGIPAQPRPGIPAQPRPGIPAQPRPGIPAQPRPGIPAQPRPGIPAQPRPGIPAQPRLGIPAQPRPGIPAQPRPGILAQPRPGISAQPRPGIPAQPRPGIPAQPRPGIPAQPRPLIPAQPRPGFPAQPRPSIPGQPRPGIPAQPRPGLPTLPRPGIPAQPRPGLLMTPQPGLPVKPRPGLPTQPQPGTPVQPKPGPLTTPQPPAPAQPKPPTPGKQGPNQPRADWV